MYTAILKLDSFYEKSCIASDEWYNVCTKLLLNSKKKRN